MKIAIMFPVVALLGIGISAHADVVKCTASHAGKPSRLVVYIERVANPTNPTLTNIVAGKSADAKGGAQIIAHFRGDLGETGFDPDNGIQLKVNEGNALTTEEKDGAKSSDSVMGLRLGQVNDMHIFWPLQDIYSPARKSGVSMQTAGSFITQIREDRSAGENSAEPRAATLLCKEIAAPGVTPNNKEMLHDFAIEDLKVQNVALPK